MGVGVGIGVVVFGGGGVGGGGRVVVVVGRGCCSRLIRWCSFLSFVGGSVVFVFLVLFFMVGIAFSIVFVAVLVCIFTVVALTGILFGGGGRRFIVLESQNTGPTHQSTRQRQQQRTKRNVSASRIF